MAVNRKKAATPKIEFSKIVLIIALLLNTGILVFSCVMMWRTCDLSPLAYIVPAVAAEVASGTASYYWKAKAENKIKLAKAYGIEITDQTIINEM